MKHTKEWLIFWIIVNLLCFAGFTYCGILCGIYKGIILAGVYFWIFAGIFLVCAGTMIANLVRHNWIKQEALYELWREEIEMAKEYYRKEWDIKNE